eukprot:gnl/MRDRNA2_/MRDRNA2_173517_c0_seq1.p1 gnl/MRDRNA2_/MRDRNA2_173517_c0~~gnl/MRDRNA2_/MRDRNA2_173517_c0_seq1.p1  ORF type:complete len:515 (+),score=51.92 gnl/MRDRNA2_/MRDRNA2_173517_c0_seq1:88-1632(+)
MSASTNPPSQATLIRSQSMPQIIGMVAQDKRPLIVSNGVSGPNTPVMKPRVVPKAKQMALLAPNPVALLPAAPALLSSTTLKPARARRAKAKAKPLIFSPRAFSPRPFTPPRARSTAPVANITQPVTFSPRASSSAMPVTFSPRPYPTAPVPTPPATFSPRAFSPQPQISSMSLPVKPVTRSASSTALSKGKFPTQAALPVPSFPPSVPAPTLSRSSSAVTLAPAKKLVRSSSDVRLAPRRFSPRPPPRAPLMSPKPGPDRLNRSKSSSVGLLGSVRNVPPSTPVVPPRATPMVPVVPMVPMVPVTPVPAPVATVAVPTPPPTASTPIAPTVQAPAVSPAPTPLLGSRTAPTPLLGSRTSISTSVNPSMTTSFTIRPPTPNPPGVNFSPEVESVTYQPAVTTVKYKAVDAAEEYIEFVEPMANGMYYQDTQYLEPVATYVEPTVTYMEQQPATEFVEVPSTVTSFQVPARPVPQHMTVPQLVPAPTMGYPQATPTRPGVFNELDQTKSPWVTIG